MATFTTSDGVDHKHPGHFTHTRINRHRHILPAHVPLARRPLHQDESAYNQTSSAAIDTGNDIARAAHGPAAGLGYIRPTGSLERFCT